MTLNEQEREAYLDYYRPLLGLKVVGMVEAEWPTLLVVHPDAPEHEFELEAASDPEGNGPGFLFFSTGDAGEEEIEIDGLTITAVDLTRDEYQDWIYWPTLTCDRPGKPPLEITVSQDAEGNGAGHLFGVPQGLEIS